MATIADMEYACALQNLRTFIAEGKNILLQPQISQYTLKSCSALLKAAVEEMEKFRPEDENNDTRQFVNVVPLLFEAKALKIRLDHLFEPIPDNVNASTPRNTSSAALPKLPKIEPITFSGDLTKYPQFVQTFDRLIHDNPTLEDGDRMTYLLSYTKDEPRRLISGLSLDPVGYEKARKVLSEHYGDKKKLVQELYTRLQAIPAAQHNTAHFRNTYENVEIVLRELETYGEDVNNNAMAFATVLRKFTALELLPFIEEENTLEKFRQSLRKFVLLRSANSKEQVSPSTSLTSAQSFEPTTTAALLTKTQSDGKSRRSNRWETETASNRPLKCIYCTGAHWPDQCTVCSTEKQRKEKVNGRCYICLRNDHLMKECKVDKPCPYCTRKHHHHRSLCPKQFGEKAPEIDTQSGTENTNPKTQPVLLTKLEDGASYFTLRVPIVNKVTNQVVMCRLVFDNCSNFTYATENLARKLNIETRKFSNLSVSGFGSLTPKKERTSLVSFQIHCPGNESVDIVARTVPYITEPIRVVDSARFVENFPQYSTLTFADTANEEEIDILLGNDFLYEISTPERIDVAKGIHLLGSKFGWLISATPQSKQSPSPTPILVALSKVVENLWSLEQIGIEPEVNNQDEEKALEAFYSTVTIEDGRYQVRWPWREFPPDLPKNFKLAYGRLQSLLKQLGKNPYFLRQYDKIIRKQIADDVVEIAPSRTEAPLHYLPHHAVFAPEKTTSLRIVYDASAKVRKSDRSLNDCIYKGVTLLENLNALLIRFRIGSVAIVADIQKAFHQILIHVNDRDVTRFLWLKNINQPFTEENILELRFRRVAFGIVASPFLLAATIHAHVTQIEPRFSEIFLNDIYVDNLITSIDNEADTLALYQETVETFRKMSMCFRDWNTNSPQVRAQFDNKHRDDRTSISVLGLKWNVLADTLSITAKLPHSVVMITKRCVLKTIAAVYDPLGLYAPVTLTAKLFLKTLWLRIYDWDTEVSPELSVEWRVIEKNLRCLCDFTIPRQYNYSLIVSDTTVIYELHCFVDASKLAYAAVVYLRTQTTHDIHTALVFSRTRITPNRPMTTPRLELLAALIGSRAIKFVADSLEKRIKINTKYLWSDSKCTLHWLKTNKILPVWLHHRVKEIQANGKCQLRYIKSEDNPADLASRGGNAETLSDSWWKGPTWLATKNENWPVNDPADSDTIKDIQILETPVLATIKTTAVVSRTILTLSLENYSTLNRLLTITAFCACAVNKIIKRKVCKIRDQDDQEYSLKTWIRSEQQAFFSDVIESLESKKPNSFARSLGVYIDTEQLLRCKGRYEFSPLSEEEKCPILLAPHSYLTKLIILDTHFRNFHVGTAHVLANLRKRFWLPHGRRTIDRILKNCPRCARYTKHPYAMPQIAPLPPFRVEPRSAPFKNTGIDIFGPLYVRNSKNGPLEKRWVLVFTCLTIRALHLELLTTLTSSEIMHAFRRFIAVRGTPTLVLSDNAPQFKVIDATFRTLWQIVTTDADLQRLFRDQRIQWKYVPQLSPWMGGVYERLIGLTKNALKRTFHGKTLNDRHLRTIIAEISATLNNRPLTYVDCHLDSKILVPNDFLQLIDTATPPLTENTQKSIPTRDPREIVLTIYKKGMEILNQFWHCWHRDYLLNLRERAEGKSGVQSAYRTARVEPQIGEIVLVADTLKRRNQWKKAVIEELIPSADGSIRAAKIRLASGLTTLRPITKLVPLELNLETALHHNKKEEQSQPRPPPEIVTVEDSVEEEDLADVAAQPSAAHNFPLEIEDEIDHLESLCEEIEVEEMIAG